MENPFEIIFEKPDTIVRLLLELKERHMPLHSGGDSLNNTKELMTTNQLAEYLSVSLPSIYLLSSQRDIPMIKKGKRFYFI